MLKEKIVIKLLFVIIKIIGNKLPENVIREIDTVATTISVNIKD